MAYLDQVDPDDLKGAIGAATDPNAVNSNPGYLQQMQAQQQQQVQQQQAQQSAAQNQINPTPTGTNVAGQTVTPGMASMGNSPLQQSIQNANGGVIANYTDPTTGKDINPNPVAYTMPSNRPDPNKMSGIMQGAYARGQIAGQQMINQKQAQGNANETQSFQRQEFTKQQQIAQGMQQSALKGGYGGVVNFLQTADPERAIKLQQQKAELDQSMLKTDSMAMLNDDQKKNSLFAGYGLLGKMGATLLAAPPSDRANLYQHMLPMVQAVVPDAPTSLNNDAVSMLQLGAGQAKLPSQLWAAAGDAKTSSSALGQINDDIAAGAALGKTPQNDPGQAALVAKQQAALQDSKLKQYQVDDLKTRSAMQQAQMAKSQQDQQSAALGVVNKVQNGLNAQSKDYNDFYNNYSKFKGAVNALQANPNDPAAQTALGQVVPTLITNTKRINPAMIQQYSNTDNGIEGFLKEKLSMVNADGKIVMSPEEVGRLSNLGNYIYQGMSANQAHTNALYKDQANKYITDPTGKDPQYGEKQVKFPTTADVPTKQQIDSDFNAKAQSGQYTMQQLNAAKQLIYSKYGYSQ
jgi:hypothetical protein